MNADKITSEVQKKIVWITSGFFGLIHSTELHIILVPVCPQSHLCVVFLRIGIICNNTRQICRNGGGVKARHSVRHRQDAWPLSPVFRFSFSPGQEVETQVREEFVMQRSINEWVVASGAHGKEVTGHLDDVDIVLPQDGEVCVQVADQVHHLWSKHRYPKH